MRGIEPRTGQSAASLYTDYAIPAPNKNIWGEKLTEHSKHLHTRWKKRGRLSTAKEAGSISYPRTVNMFIVQKNCPKKYVI
jgi:hypothetical protein